MGGYDYVVLYSGEPQSSYREKTGSMLATGPEIECVENNRIGSVKAVGTTFLAYQIVVKFPDAARFKLNAAYTHDKYYKYDHPYHFYTRFGFKTVVKENLSTEDLKGSGKSIRMVLQGEDLNKFRERFVIRNDRLFDRGVDCTKNLPLAKIPKRVQTKIKPRATARGPLRSKRGIRKPAVKPTKKSSRVRSHSGRFCIACHLGIHSVLSYFR